MNACNLLLEAARDEIGARDPAVNGFNIGVNDRESAAQAVFHTDVYLIPRRTGDVAEPGGGVRYVIPG